MMRAHGTLIFASAAQGSATEVQRHPRNFTGCLKGLELNGEPISVGDVAEWAGPGSRRVFGVYQCCSRAGACDNNPCQNGWVCEEDANGGECTEWTECGRRMFLVNSHPLLSKTKKKKEILSWGRTKTVPAVLKFRLAVRSRLGL